MHFSLAISNIEIRRVPALNMHASKCASFFLFFAAAKTNRYAADPVSRIRLSLRDRKLRTNKSELLSSSTSSSSSSSSRSTRSTRSTFILNKDRHRATGLVPAYEPELK
jgi:hypothetical protein